MPDFNLTPLPDDQGPLVSEAPQISEGEFKRRFAAQMLKCARPGENSDQAELEEYVANAAHAYWLEYSGAYWTGDETPEGLADADMSEWEYDDV